MHIGRSVSLLLLAALVVMLLPHPAAAQKAASELRHSVHFGPWFTSVASGPGAWQTTLWAFEYRLTSGSPWGLQLRYASGSSDLMWSADATYLVRPSPIGVRVFAGYASFKWERTLPAPTGLRRVTSTGLRLGADVAYPLQLVAGADLSLIASTVVHPSNSVTVLSSGATTTTTASATQWGITLRYTLPRRQPARASEVVPASTELTTLQQEFDGTGWDLCYCVTTEAGSNTTSSGVMVTFRASF